MVTYVRLRSMCFLQSRDGHAEIEGSERRCWKTETGEMDWRKDEEDKGEMEVN